MLNHPRLIHLLLLQNLNFLIFHLNLLFKHLFRLVNFFSQHFFFHFNQSKLFLMHHQLHIFLLQLFYSLLELRFFFFLLAFTIEVVFLCSFYSFLVRCDFYQKFLIHSVAYVFVKYWDLVHEELLDVKN